MYVNRNMLTVKPMIGQALQQALRHLGFEAASVLRAARAQLASRHDRASRNTPTPYIARFAGKMRTASALSVLLLSPALSGCILGTEKPELNLEIPSAYREGGHSAPDRALPALDWWRGFRSSELTTLMEASQIQNLDIAVAIAQIFQADAQVGVSGAPLL